MDEVGITLREHVVKSSIDTLSVCNLDVYVYGLDQIHGSVVDELTILSVVHPRGRDYRYSELVAHELLHYYRTHGGTKNVIAVTFDAWNHGKRLTEPERNVDWKSGNQYHAQDMMAQIEGTAREVSLVMDFLPAYLPFEARNVSHVVTGVSLGGHICWRVAQHRGSAGLRAMAPVIGSPYMSLLLLERLQRQVPDGGSVTDISDKSLIKTTKTSSKAAADALRTDLGPDAAKLWSPAVHNLIVGLDSLSVDSGIKVLACNGGRDRLVPAKFTEAFFDVHGGSSPDLELFVQADAPHTCTPQMLDRIGQWLVDLTV